MKSLEEPVSDFGKRLLQDFPSITKSEVRDITFNLLRSAAHAASLPGNQASSSSANKHIRVTQDRKAVAVKRSSATRADLQPLPITSAPTVSVSNNDDSFVNVATLPYNTPREGIERLALAPVRPYAFGAPRPWDDSNSPDTPVIQPPLKIQRLESPELASAPSFSASSSSALQALPSSAASSAAHPAAMPAFSSSAASSSAAQPTAPSLVIHSEISQPKKKARVLSRFTSAEAVEEFLRDEG